MARRSNKKLYDLTSASFTLPSFIRPDGQPHLISADNIPMLCWPDGSWCMEANLYMLRLYKNMYSRKHGGGTLLSYATQISPLIRYCFHANISLYEVSDSHFHLFIKGLSAEVKFSPSRQRIRSDRQVRAIGQRCLDFLISIGKLCADAHYVSEGGRITISLKEVTSSKGKRHHKRIVVLRDHPSFPQATPLNSRLPISNDSIALIKAAVTRISSSSFLKLRRLVMLRLFEATGARRVEVSQVRVADILRAINDGTYKVEFNSAKQGTEANPKRLIPLTYTDLKFIKSYIDIHRSAVIKRTCGKLKDSEFLFISETTGAPLRPNTLTQEMSQLRIAAKLTSQACLHMFRHRFITKLFVYHLEKHHNNNESTFISLNKQIETIKAMVKELTGHKDPDSLNFYINLAFEEASFFKASHKNFLQANSMDAFHADVKRLREEMKFGLCPNEATDQLLRMFEDYMENFSD